MQQAVIIYRKVSVERDHLNFWQITEFTLLAPSKAVSNGHLDSWEPRTSLVAKALALETQPGIIERFLKVLTASFFEHEYQSCECFS